MGRCVWVITMLKIIQAPNEILNVTCRDVQGPTKAFYKLVKDMKRAMQAANGVGLAAPQVGYDLRMFVTTTRVYVNPVIVERSPSTVFGPEGCLSIKHAPLTIKRHASLRVAYQPCNVYDEKTLPHVLIELTGQEAIIFQHELDHLDGVLYTQRWAEQFTRQFQ